MSNFPWLKLWNEAPDDPKWIAVADLAGCAPQTAFYTFAKALAYANEHDRPGGSITGLHPQVIASFCRVSLAEVSRILQAFRELGILIGERIAKWKKRQTEKVAKLRSANAERQATHRAKVAAAQGNLDLGSALVAPVMPVTPVPEALLSSVTSAPDLEEEEDFNSEAEASEREPAIAAVIKIETCRKEKTVARGHRRSRISADWQPDDQDRQYAATKGYDHEWVEGQAERFRDHHLKTGSMCADWNAAWRTWIQRADDFAGRNGGGRSGDDRAGPGTILAAFARVRAMREAS